jgi:hypothetical protein
MNVRSLIQLFVFLISCISISAFADDPQLNYHRTQELTIFGLGVGVVSLSGSSTSVQALALSASYRKGFSDTKFSFYGQGAPIFQSASIFGVQATIAAGYQVMGTNRIVTEYSDNGQPVFSQKTPDSNFKLFIDAGITVLPVFGSSTTASYSGFFIQGAAYSEAKSLSLALQLNSLTLGTRSLTMGGLFLSYFWNLR